MHAYIPMKDASFTAVKSDQNIVQIMCLLNMVYTTIYRYIPVSTKYRHHIYPCGSQCDVDFQGLSMHAYIPMKDASFTAVKSEKKNSADCVC